MIRSVSCRASASRRVSKTRRTRSSPSMRTCACWRPAPTTCGCPDFGLRLSRWQGLDILGPIAVIARNAQTLLGGLEAIARYLYVHSPALRLTLAPHTAETGLRFIYELTEPGLPDVVQGYELSMAIVVRIIRLLGGPEARPSAISFMHEQQGSDAAYREALGCPVRFRQTWCGFELAPRLADRRIESADPETRRIAAKYLESQLPAAHRVAVRTRGGADPPAAAHRPMQRRRHRGPTRDASTVAATTPGDRGRAMSGPHRAGTPRPGGEIPRRTGVASQPDRGPARLYRAERPQPLVPTLVREDASAIPNRTDGQRRFLFVVSAQGVLCL